MRDEIYLALKLGQELYQAATADNQHISAIADRYWGKKFGELKLQAQQKKTHHHASCGDNNIT